MNDDNVKSISIAMKVGPYEIVENPPTKDPLAVYYRDTLYEDGTEFKYVKAHTSYEEDDENGLTKVYTFNVDYENYNNEDLVLLLVDESGKVVSDIARGNPKHRKEFLSHE